MLENSLQNLVLCCVAIVFGKSMALQDIESHPNYHLLGPAAECGRPVYKYLKSYEPLSGIAPRIKQGIPVPTGHMPWMVHLYIVKEEQTQSGNIVRIKQTVRSCGGSLISKRYVLSAAHCTDDFSKIYVYFPMGDYDLDKCPFNHGWFDCEDKYDLAERIINHKDHNYTTHQYDISLLRLSKDVKFDSYLRPICLPTRSDHLKMETIGSKVVAAGWGAHSDSRWKPQQHNKLQKVTLSLVTCPKEYLLTNTTTGAITLVTIIPSQICAGTNGRYDKGVCRGDSGGPVQSRTMINGSVKYFQVALSSTADACFERHKRYAKDTFTRVSPFVPWILDNLEE